ncbi:MAG: hypothetical protein ACRC0L_09285, partial [Angustibacter sp.]
AQGWILAGDYAEELTRAQAKANKILQKWTVGLALVQQAASNLRGLADFPPTHEVLTNRQHAQQRLNQGMQMCRQANEEGLALWRHLEAFGNDYAQRIKNVCGEIRAAGGGDRGQALLAGAGGLMVGASIPLAIAVAPPLAIPMMAMFGAQLGKWAWDSFKDEQAREKTRKWWVDVVQDADDPRLTQEQRADIQKAQRQLMDDVARQTGVPDFLDGLRRGDPMQTFMGGMALGGTGDLLATPVMLAPWAARTLGTRFGKPDPFGTPSFARMEVSAPREMYLPRESQSLLMKLKDDPAVQTRLRQQGVENLDVALAKPADSVDWSPTVPRIQDGVPGGPVSRFADSAGPGARGDGPGSTASGGPETPSRPWWRDHMLPPSWTDPLFRKDLFPISGDPLAHMGDSAK